MAEKNLTGSHNSSDSYDFNNNVTNDILNSQDNNLQISSKYCLVLDGKKFGDPGFFLKTKQYK